MIKKHSKFNNYIYKNLNLYSMHDIIKNVKCKIVENKS